MIKTFKKKIIFVYGSKASNAFKSKLKKYWETNIFNKYGICIIFYDNSAKGMRL